jgi:NitT/TauT family transport system permease protein
MITLPKLSSLKFYSRSEGSQYANYWDLIALCLVLAILVLLGLGARSMGTPYHLGEPIPISLDIAYLPYYAFRSVLRMGLALLVSLVFTLIVGTAAARSIHARRLLIPMIDVLQSVPVLGYLSITVVAFIAIFPNSMLGPECAAIFAIFTAQVWNMTLSFYQSLTTVPHDLQEAARMLQLSAWQRFWKLDVPFAMPGLLWNAMMSMSASWFFVVASEAITVNQQNITLPGIGSYIAVAVAHANIHAVLYAILTMFIVILIYDQLLFRPLNDWSQKFKFEQLSEDEETGSWVVRLFRRTKLLRHSGNLLFRAWESFTNLPLFIGRIMPRMADTAPRFRKSRTLPAATLWYIFLGMALLAALIVLTNFVFATVTLQEAVHVVFLGALTALRVMVLILLSSLIWIPIGVWMGMRPRVASFAQPIIQFLASFPVNLVYPVVVLLVVKFDLNADIWTSPLMILGSQWYIAFNVIAGVSALPKDLRQTASLFNLRGRLWWQYLVLPGILPYYVTGAITAAGGAWNASIIAEVVSWGHTTIVATGLGSYITNQASHGDFPRLALGIGVMCMYVLTINHLLWRPLYRLAAERFRLA